MPSLPAKPLESRSVARPALESRFASLRVAIVSDAITGRNGVGTYYPDLIAHLHQSLDEIQLIAPTESPDRTLERFSVPMPGDASQRLVWPRTRSLENRLDEIRPSVVVIPALGALSYFAIRYCQRNKVPFVLVHHTNFDQLLTLYWSNRIASPIQSLLKRVYAWGMRHSSGVAAMNSESLHQARQQGVNLVRVMGTPIGQSFMTHPRHDLRSTPRRVLFVGRLAAEKGLERLLRAAEKMPETEFSIGGEGPLREQVLEATRSSKNIRYLGWLDRRGVLDAMDQNDLLVLPSAFETFGTVALEALARHRYVLVGRDCGIGKWPSFAEGLFYVEPEQTLEDAIRLVQEMPLEHRTVIASKGWEAVESFCEHTKRAWLRLLADAADRRRDCPS